MATAERVLVAGREYGWKRVLQSSAYRAAALFNKLPAMVFTRATQYSIDMVACAFAVFFSYQLRFDSVVPADYRLLMWAGILCLPVLRLANLKLLGVYDGIWRYFNFTDMGHLVVSAASVSAALLVARYVFAAHSLVGVIPVSVIVLEFGTFVG